jgi:hypothetical protein
MDFANAHHFIELPFMHLLKLSICKVFQDVYHWLMLFLHPIVIEWRLLDFATAHHFATFQFLPRGCRDLARDFQSHSIESRDPGGRGVCPGRSNFGRCEDISYWRAPPFPPSPLASRSNRSIRNWPCSHTWTTRSEPCCSQRGIPSQTEMSDLPCSAISSHRPVPNIAT